MKFIVSSTGLYSHLQAISRVINSKNSLPILDCFLMDLNDGTLSITASDSETTLTTSIEVNESDANGRFAVNSKTILDALKEIPEQPLAFEVGNNMELVVKYQNGKYNFMAQNADEYPQTPQMGSNSVYVNIEAQTLIECKYSISIIEADLYITRLFRKEVFQQGCRFLRENESSLFCSFCFVSLVTHQFVSVRCHEGNVFGSDVEVNTIHDWT